MFAALSLPRPADASIPVAVSHPQLTQAAPTFPTAPSAYVLLRVAPDGSCRVELCRNDPVNVTDPMGLDVWLVYRRFEGGVKSRLWTSWKYLPIHPVGHVFLVFTDDNMGADGSQELQEWHDLVRQFDDTWIRTELKQHSFSLHPIEVWQDKEAAAAGLPVPEHPNSKVGVALTEGSVVIPDQQEDLAAFNLPSGGVGKALVTKDRATQMRIFRTVLEWKKSGKLDYNYESKNCGYWATKMVRDTGSRVPLRTRFWNLGAGTRGPADLAGISPATYGAVKGAYCTVEGLDAGMGAISTGAEWAQEKGLLSGDEDPETGAVTVQFNVLNWGF